MKKALTGINIQFPISTSILDRSKTIETRTYPLPKKFCEKELALIETPGPNGKFQARIVAIIVFLESFKYPSEKSFYDDYKRHLIDENSLWKWKDGKPKWGWPVADVRKLITPLVAPSKKGIVFTSGVFIPELKSRKPS